MAAVPAFLLSHPGLLVVFRDHPSGYPRFFPILDFSLDGLDKNKRDQAVQLFHCDPPSIVQFNVYPWPRETQVCCELTVCLLGHHCFFGDRNLDQSSLEFLFDLERCSCLVVRIPFLQRTERAGSVFPLILQSGRD